jgi:hypothetical protein
MRRALRKAGWALATAGGIGIAAPALAQPEIVRVLGPGGQVVPAGQVMVMTESQLRHEEVQVELALLADPMLFSYGLGAHAEGGTLAVRGFVPTETAREQALKAAREHTILPVIDRLQVHAGLATRSSIDKPENIRRAAKALLEDAFPEQGRGMDVRCDARGRVTVTGSIASAEHRLLVSRKLRQVYGCSCVANQLVVAPARKTAPAEETKSDPIIPDMPPVSVRPAVRKSEPPKPPPPPTRPAMTPARKDSELPSLRMPRTHPDPLPPIPAPAPAVKPAPADPALPPIKPETRRPAPVPRLDTDQLYGGDTAPKVLAPVTTAGWSAPSVITAAKALPPLAPPPLTRPKPAPVPALPPLAKASPVERHHPGGSEESYVSEGTVTLEDDPPPLPPVSSGPKVLSGAPTKPAVGTLTLAPPPMPPGKSASGPVTLTASPSRIPTPPAPAPPPPPKAPAAVRLKERTQAICGPACEVQVIAKGKDVLQLNLTGRSNADGRRLMERITPILRSPEFAAYEINVDIVVPAP